MGTKGYLTADCVVLANLVDTNTYGESCQLQYPKCIRIVIGQLAKGV